MNKGWILQDQVYFLERLGLLLEKGYSLSIAIRLFSWHLPKKKQEQMNQILIELKGGIPLHESLQILGFSKDIIGYILFAEKHGDLSITLLNTSQILRSRLTYRKKIEKLLRYPLVLFVIVAVMFYLIYRYILPSFLQLYESMNIENALFSKWLITTFSMLPLILLITILLVMLLTILYFLWFKRLLPTKQMKLMYKIPIVKTMLSLFNTHYFTSQISNLLNGGLSVLESLTVMNEQYIIPFYREQAGEIIVELTSGESFENVLRKNLFFEAELAVVAAHGQANGMLGRELNDYSHLIFRRFEEKVNKFISVLQPSLFVLIGVLVIGVYASIMLPLFEMMKQI